MLIPASDGEQTQYGGAFKWLYEEDAVSPHRLHDELAAVGQKLGLSSLGAEWHEESQEKGYARFEVSLPLSEHDINLWLEKTTDLTRDESNARVQALVTSYFEQQSAAEEICHFKPFCLKRRLHAARHTLHKLMADLEHMRKLDLDSPERASLLAHFGYHLAKDRFALAYLAGLLDHPLQVSLEIMSEHSEPFAQIIEAGATARPDAYAVGV